MARIRDIGGPLTEAREQLKQMGAEGALEETQDVVDEMFFWIDEINQEGPIPEYFNDLPSFFKELEKARDQAVGAVAARTASSLKDIADADVPDISAEIADLQEAAHFAFIEGSEDRIQPAVDAVDKVLSYQGNVTKVLAWAKSAAKYAESAKTVAGIEKAIGSLKGAGGVLDKIGKVAKSAHALATISGVDNVALASYEDDINKFEAALEAIDVTGVIDAVPVLGALWSEYYVPAAKQSLKLLRGIGRHRDVEGRTIGFIEFEQTGKLPKGARKYFPGGEPVLRFMLAIKRDEEPTPSASVRKFFLEHQSLFNAPFEGGTNELESEGGGIFGGEEKLTNLMSWVKLNKHLVWAMLYGSFEIYG